MDSGGGKGKGKGKVISSVGASCGRINRPTRIPTVLARRREMTAEAVKKIKADRPNIERGPMRRIVGFCVEKYFLGSGGEGKGGR